MKRPTFTPEILRGAYELAFFLQCDKELAIKIATGAAARLEVATTAQNKRLYYRPFRSAIDVRGPAKFKPKISLSDVHLLQRLIYIESEPYEKQREQHSTPSQEDLAVYFIKHLVRITLKRNSFYVNLGISRLLHNYSTAESMEIYNAVVQDPERVKDDYYYRSRKGVLMNELKDRFGDLLRTYRGPHGEERFQESTNPGAFAELAQQSLTFFTPWATPCLVPYGFDPAADELSRFVTRDPREEDNTEVNRIHALTHPDCFRRLIGALGFLGPDEKLALPQFFLEQNRDDAGSGSRRHSAPELDDEKVKEIERDLAREAGRRKRSAAGLLRVMVDGVERARLQPDRARSTKFTIENDAELVEVKTSDAQGELLLAMHLIDYDEVRADKSSMHRIVLEGGQSVSINTSPSSGEAAGGIVVEVSYQEAMTFRARAFLFGRSSQMLSPWLTQGAWRRARVLVPVLMLAFLIIAVIGLRLYTHKRSELTVAPDKGAPPVRTPPAPEKATPEAEALRNATPAATPQGPSAPGPKVKKAEQGITSRTAARRLRVSQTKNQSRRQDQAAITPSPATAERNNSNSERTRTPATNFSGVSLLEVKNVFVEALGGGSSAQLVASMLLDRLRDTKTFVLIEARDDADAVLKISARTPSSVENTRRRKSPRIAVVASLVNANGEIVWPLRNRGSRAYYSGTAAGIAARITNDLRRDIQQLKRVR